MILNGNRLCWFRVSFSVKPCTGTVYNFEFHPVSFPKQLMSTTRSKSEVYQTIDESIRLMSTFANLTCCILLFIRFWHAALRVHRTKRRHQSPEWAILSQVDCFV